MNDSLRKAPIEESKYESMSGQKMAKEVSYKTFQPAKDGEIASDEDVKETYESIKGHSNRDYEINEEIEVIDDEEGDMEATPQGLGTNASNARGISINPLDSGYMVKVGCQSVAVETTDKLVDMLNKYLSDPNGFEKRWYSKDVRNRLENI